MTRTRKRGKRGKRETWKTCAENVEWENVEWENVCGKREVGKRVRQDPDEGGKRVPSELRRPT